MSEVSTGAGLLPDELPALRSALKDLLDACLHADACEDLPECIDGSLLDAASNALDLQYPVIWTAEQVEMLKARQADTTMHPYTCGGDRSDRAHRFHAEESCEEAGSLYPTMRGWICPACDYRQFWSHETGGPDALRTPAAAPDLVADVARLREALTLFQSFGCPACGGDCGSANPPVTSCPMGIAHQALAAIKDSPDV